jgi:hypothetical protein
MAKPKSARAAPARPTELFVKLAKRRGREEGTPCYSRRVGQATTLALPPSALRNTFSGYALVCGAHKRKGGGVFNSSN